MASLAARSAGLSLFLLGLSFRGGGAGLSFRGGGAGGFCDCLVVLVVSRRVRGMGLIGHYLFLLFEKEISPLLKKKKVYDYLYCNTCMQCNGLLVTMAFFCVPF